MKQLKKWSYPVIFLAVGVYYLACVDHWQVYAEPLRHIQEWYETLGSGAEEPEKEPEAPGTAETIPDSSLNPDGESGEEDFGESGAETGGEVPDTVSGGDGAGNEDIAGDGNQEETDEKNDDTEPDKENDGTVTYMTVEDDYFADAVFIGDSRTMGMYEYGGLEEITTFYASKGLTVYKLFESEIAQTAEGKKSVEEALQQNTFAKIYLMIGINEMGTGTVETFLEKYREVVEHLRELQPDAIIYLQAIIKVTSERSAKGDYINNEGIEARNQGIALLADNEKVFYLDVNPLICDESGGMNPDYTFDGVHLLGKYIEIWKDYLKAHAISP